MRRREDGILQVRYEPRPSYALDLEIMALSDFRSRLPVLHRQTPQRVEFGLLMYFTSGRCVHGVDFEALACKPGTMLVLRPGQVLRIDPGRSHWEGWLLLFRPEFVSARSAPPSLDTLEAFQALEELPARLALQSQARSAVEETLVRIHRDTRTASDAKAVNALLRCELMALLARLFLAHLRATPRQTAAPATVARFRRFRQAVEQDFRQQHKVADYASRLGCSEKSLGRAVQEVTGSSAKAYLSRRIALEGKRLLVHTALPVALIADQLGFSEATNFVKFFQREAGMSPGAFRRGHGHH